MRMALSAAETHAQVLDAQLRKLDEVRSKTDELLYQMIPKQVRTTCGMGRRTDGRGATDKLSNRAHKNAPI